jgi:hypothetical protein
MGTKGGSSGTSGAATDVILFNIGSIVARGGDQGGIVGLFCSQGDSNVGGNGEDEQQDKGERCRTVSSSTGLHHCFAALSVLWQAVCLKVLEERGLGEEQAAEQEVAMAVV